MSLILLNKDLTKVQKIRFLSRKHLTPLKSQHMMQLIPRSFNIKSQRLCSLLNITLEIIVISLLMFGNKFQLNLSFPIWRNCPFHGLHRQTTMMFGVRAFETCAGEGEVVRDIVEVLESDGLFTLSIQ
jgi:hypothetical protein